MSRHRKVQNLPKNFDPKAFVPVNPSAAGIDIGSRFHVVAVGPGCDPDPVRRFGCYTPDLTLLVDWLERCGIKTVAMESTGVYWIPLYQMLDARGVDVCLIRPQDKNLPGRKDDEHDAVWLQKLHTFGLLSASFRPSFDICVVRSYWRLRADLVARAADELRHMQKALDQMNIHLHKAISDISGETGMSVLRAIVSGQYDPQVLAAYRNPRIKCKKEELIKALTGDYRPEHVFALRQALERYDAFAKQVADCDHEVEKCMQAVVDKLPQQPEGAPKPIKRFQAIKHPPAFNLHSTLYKLTGHDLTSIDGMGPLTVMTVVTEVGLDMGRWRTEDKFCSWLGLTPNHKVSGGKVLSHKTRHVINRATTAFRMAALALSRGPSALGAFYRRLKAKIGAPKALTATAHKLAKQFYRILRYGGDYVDQGEQKYQEQIRDRQLKALRRRAAALGCQVTEAAT
jgi:transposase